MPACCQPSLLLRVLACRQSPREGGQTARAHRCESCPVAALSNRTVLANNSAPANDPDGERWHVLERSRGPTRHPGGWGSANRADPVHNVCALCVCFWVPISAPAEFWGCGVWVVV